MLEVVRKLWILSIFCAISGLEADNFQIQSPTVLIVTLIRNKAHTLPYFFTYIEDLNYPKDKISIW